MTWFERSEPGQPAMYGHTEQKAMLQGMYYFERSAKNPLILSLT
jgi:hypothetical protein